MLVLTARRLPVYCIDMAAALLLVLTLLCYAINPSSSLSFAKARATSTSRSRLLSSVADEIIDVQPVISREALKCDILKKSLLVSRGEIASSNEKFQITDLVRALESSAAPRPTEEMFYGRWSLVFSDTQLFRSSPFFLAARAVCQDGDEADRFNLFCDLHRDALSFSQIGKVSQEITATSITSYFETKVSVVSGLPFVIKGTIQSTADIISLNTEGDESIMQIFMDKVRIQEYSSNIPVIGDALNNFSGLPIRTLGNFLESTLLAGRYKNPKPVLRTKYIDGDFRVTRDQDDNVFVFVRDRL